MGKPILLVSGDSWTDSNFESVHHPEMDTSWKKWPEILAEKLELNLVNVAFSGSGNQYIYSSLLDKIVELDNIALVIAGWSKGSRSDYEIGGIKRNIMHDSRGDIDYFIKRNLRLFYSLQTVCAYHNLPLKQFHMLHPHWHTIHGEDKHSKESIDKRRLNNKKILLSNHYQDKISDNFAGFPGDQDLGGYTIHDFLEEREREDNKIYFISELDRHPNKKGQEKIAGLIHENL